MTGRGVRKGFLDTVFQGPRQKPHSSASIPPREDEEVGAVGAVTAHTHTQRAHAPNPDALEDSQPKRGQAKSYRA